MLVTSGSPLRIWRKESPPSLVNQTVPSVIPTKKLSGCSGSPATARGAALKWLGNPPESLSQESPWFSLRYKADAAPSGRRQNGGGTAAAGVKSTFGRSG